MRPGPDRRARIRLDVTGDGAQQRRLARTVGTGEGDTLGAANCQVNAVVGEQLPPTTADLKAVAPKHGAPRGHVGAGHVEHDGVVVAKRTFCLVELYPRLVHPFGVYVIGPACRLLRVPFQLACDDFRQPGILQVARRGARPPGSPFAGLLPLPLFAPQLLLGVAQVCFRDLSGLLYGLLVHAEIAAVEQHFAAIQLGDAVHPVQQHAIVADQHQTSRIVIQRVVEAMPRIRVEVVGRLVEQQDLVAPATAGQPSDTTSPPDNEPSRRSKAMWPKTETSTMHGCVPRCPVVADRGEASSPASPASNASGDWGHRQNTSATVRSATNGTFCGR
jgi:hypothetical protein